MTMFAPYAEGSKVVRVASVTAQATYLPGHVELGAKGYSSITSAQCQITRSVLMVMDETNDGPNVVWSVKKQCYIVLCLAILFQLPVISTKRRKKCGLVSLFSCRKG